MESRRKAPRILLSGGRLVDPEERALRAGDLWLEGGRVVAETPRDPQPEWTPGSYLEIALAGRWVLPGFVQAHLHLCQTLLRGWAEGRTLYRWLAEVIWPGEAAHDAATMTVAAELGIRQLLSGGTTAILDMGTTRHTESIAEVAARLGLRATLGPALMDRGPDAARGLLLSPTESLARFEAFAAAWDGHDAGRIRAALCPRFVPSVSEPLWRELTRRPDLARFPIHTHGAETEEEVAEVRSLTGKSPIGYLASLPGVSGRLCLAHAVWLDDDDRRALNDSGLAVCHCPSSNLKLGSGLADLRALRDAGVTVGLGADGAPCNNRLDPWQEMRQAAFVATARRGPESIDPWEILALATAGGADALGQGEEIGRLRPGYQADFCLLDPERDPATSGTDLEPSEDGNRLPANRLRAMNENQSEVGARFREDPAALLVFAGSPALVVETWVAGRQVYRADAPLDPDLGDRVRAARGHLRSRLHPRKGNEP
ncbi:MAG: amidohydrolase family protein [Candidatus Eisenbacteria bacterium]|nr:amidohydrolase family protein [Candidatus Eisenbacteria bacterium]